MALLSFGDVLAAQLDDSLPYPALKTMLRSVRAQPLLPYPRLVRPKQHHESCSSPLLSCPLTLSCSLAASPPASLPPTTKSRLRRKRRRSRRHPELSTRLFEDDEYQVNKEEKETDEDEDEDVNEEAQIPDREQQDILHTLNTRYTVSEEEEEDATDSTSSQTKKPRCHANAPPRVTVSGARELAAYLNRMLCDAAARGVVDWGSFRPLVTSTLRYRERSDVSVPAFCDFVDSVFDPDDVLASAAPRVFYSDVFWLKTWADFVDAHT